MLFPINKKDLPRCRYSSPFGTRWGRSHRGVDISAPLNTRIYTPLDGVVHMSRLNGPGTNTGYGYYLVIHHPQDDLYTLYAHLNEFSDLEVGTKVQAGDLIAHTGNSGSSTGPHVHIEVHENDFKFSSEVGKGVDSAVDPVKYYPGLEGLLHSNLGIYTEKISGGDYMEFKNKWQNEQFVESLRSLGKKGKLHNPDDWIGKFEKGKLTHSEVGLIALSLIDRIIE